MARYISPTMIEHDGLFTPADFKNADYRALLASGVTITPWAEPTVAELLARERAAMNPARLAFFLAMSMTPRAGYPHLLAKVTETIEAERALNAFALNVMWFDSVQQIVRTHPNMTTFRNLFNLTDAQVDDLCRLALQIEAGA